MSIHPYICNSINTDKKIQIMVGQFSENSKSVIMDVHKYDYPFICIYIKS